MPMATEERITREAGSEDAWVCLCGNIPISDGFYSCDENGNEVEPTIQDWKTNWYVCARCGRMIDQATLEVVGLNNMPTFLV